jgi:spermidine synthase
VVWLSVLSTVVGGTTVAASATLAVFFLGLGIGSALGGRISARAAAPLRTCVVVELGIALSAGAFLLLLGPMGNLYRELFTSIGHAATILIALILLLPPSVLMGMTLPLVAEALVGSPGELGRKGSLIYASNTLGGATGAALSAFWLIAEFGVPTTCAIAAVLNGGAALGLLTVSAPTPHRANHADIASRVPQPALLLAAASGFFMLALEVLWTRMLVQVVHNSVYTFGAVLLTFLLSLGIASGLVALGTRLSTVRRHPRIIAAALALIAMGAVVWSAHIFSPLTEGYQRIQGDDGFAGYILQVIMVSGATFVPAAIVAGMLFPMSLQLAGPSVRSAGAGLGSLGSTNTLAAIVGSLFGGFVLVSDPFGLFDSLAWVAGGYALIALFLIPKTQRHAHFIRVAIIALGCVAVLSSLGIDPPIALKQRERLIDMRQGVGGIVAVTEKRGNRKIKINNNYTLGSTRASRYQRRQAHIPMILHPNPEQVLFIGLGSGLTANAALDHEPVQKLTVAELTKEVVDLAGTHFSDQASKLYSDPRASIVADDARHYLATHEHTYDVIVGDLFVPWRSGVGNLYSQEHFEVVRSRLRPGGLFAQWIPLYQMSQFEVAVVAKTLASVFGEIEVWRCEFQAKQSILALVGRAPEGSQLDPSGLATRAEAHAKKHVTTPRWMRGYGFFELYAGKLNKDAALFDGVPLNTDQQPVISYQAPRTHRAVLSGQASWVRGAGYLKLLKQIREDMGDALNAEAAKHAYAGYLFHEQAIRKRLKQAKKAKRAKTKYRELRQSFSTAGR